MEIPTDREVIEIPTATYWEDDEGILCSVARRAGPLSLDDVKHMFTVLHQRIGNRKVCILADVTHATVEISRENRDYAAVELPKITKAVAMVSHSVLGKMLANLFFTLKTQPYPTKMFTNETAAREWLRQYL